MTCQEYDLIAFMGTFNKFSVFKLFELDNLFKLFLLLFFDNFNVHKRQIFFSYQVKCLHLLTNLITKLS